MRLGGQLTTAESCLFRTAGCRICGPSSVLRQLYSWSSDREKNKFLYPMIRANKFKISGGINVPPSPWSPISRSNAWFTSCFVPRICSIWFFTLCSRTRLDLYLPLGTFAQPFLKSSQSLLLISPVPGYRSRKVCELHVWRYCPKKTLLLGRVGKIG